MKIIEKLPLIKIASLVLLVTIITSTAVFGGTFAWFVGTESLTVSGSMGKVEISLKGNTIENRSDIPIIVRVRVIVEQLGNEIPTDDAPDVAITGNNWTKGPEGFYVYGTGTDGFSGYKKVEVGEHLPFTYDTLPGYTVTLIAEALQATETAFDYTVDNAGIPGVTSWALN